MKFNVKHTVSACFIAITVQAIIINFPPLLFVTFENELGISLAKIGTLIAISFITQLCMDFTASKLPRVFNTRAMLVAGQICSSVGLFCIALLPKIMPPYAGLVIGMVIAAFGSGIIEVLGNPTIEACPIENKSRILSILHSFYCWGLVLTVLVSTAFLYFFGTERWELLTCIWACIPALNAIMFIKVPIYHTAHDSTKTKGNKSVLHSFVFWALLGVMICGGAAELSMSQWASSFAETGLGVSKTVGNLLGPCAFAVLMGSARILYAKYSSRINLSAYMIFSAVLCIIAYLTAALAPIPVVSLIGCAICGFAVGIMWPGTLVMATEKVSGGGIKMFALLALAGDIGCTLGPSGAGFIAQLFGHNLRISFLFSALFPAIMILLILAINKNAKKSTSPKG